MNPDSLAKLHEQSLHYLNAFIVYRDGSQLYEYYKDINSKEVDLRSLTKTVISSLLGIAIDQGYIRSIEDRVETFFPEYEVPCELTIKHLLLHQSGIIDPVRFGTHKWDDIHMLEFLFRHMEFKSRGGPFKYSGGNTHIISSLIAKATGQDILEFASEMFFKPMRIHVDHWPCDKDGYRLGFCPDLSPGLRLKVSDLLNIGILYLNEGIWGDRRILSKNWMNQSTSLHIEAEWGISNGYGLHWWIHHHDGDIRVFSAKGNGGQRIHVIPSIKTVVVCTAPYRHWRDKMNDPDIEIFKIIFGEGAN